MSKVITGLFELPREAAAAVEELLERGVPAETISVVASEEVATETFAVETHSKLAEGAALGAGAGGGLGALIAGFTAVGALASTGVGILAAGPIVAALAGAGAGAAVGGALGGLIGLGFPEHEVKYLENALNEGSVLVGVKADDLVTLDRLDEGEIKSILSEAGAAKVSSA